MVADVDDRITGTASVPRAARSGLSRSILRRGALSLACACILSCRAPQTPVPPGACGGTWYGDGTNVPEPRRAFEVRLHNRLGAAFAVELVCIAIDHRPLFEPKYTGPIADALGGHRPVTWRGPVTTSAEHELQLTAHLRGTTDATRGYRFELRSSRKLDSNGILEIELYEQGDARTPIDERPALRYSSADASTVPGGAPSDAPGRLPPEAIKKIIRAAFPDFRKCYEAGLQKNEKLAGEIKVRFVIQMDGTTDKVEVVASTLGDPEVVGCVVAKYGSLKFPAAEGGPVTVTYPIDFSSE